MLTLLMGLYRSSRRYLASVNAKAATREFQKHCIAGVELVCGSGSRCTNLTGKRENIVIGDHCRILASFQAEANARILVGHHTSMQESTRIFSTDRVEIGNCVIISNFVTIYDNNTHPLDPEKRIAMSMSDTDRSLWGGEHSDHAPVTICDNVWIGEKATILKGVTVGKGAIIAMCAVVTKDVPPYSIAAGNPAQVVKQLVQDS